MKIHYKALPIAFLFLVTACEMNLFESEYKNLGKFDSKQEAENTALERFENQYKSLPEAGFYKVMYSFPDSVDTQNGRIASVSRRALWYDKSSQHLGVEVDVYSGMVCQWEKVDQNALQQMVSVKRGIAGIDSLAQLKWGAKSSCTD